jgi:hypothetical protein
MEQYYIVRATNAGVFFGKITDRKNDEVTMADVRKLWRWDGACAVEQLALEGTKKPDGCNFTVSVPSLVVLGVNQVIPCSEEAVKSIKAVAEWKL